MAIGTILEPFVHRGFERGAMRKRPKNDRVSASRPPMKKQGPRKQKQQNKLEYNYQEFFTQSLLPHRGAHTDADSLEQPSALEYVPTTATPTVEQ